MNGTTICAMVFLSALAAGSAHAQQAVRGKGTAATIPVWTSGTMIGDSMLTQSGGNVTNATGNVAAIQLVSTVGTGTPPLMVTSTTQVPNLNASSLGGFGPGGFIQNTASQQTGNFNLSGNGTLGGTLLAASVNSTGAYQLGGAAVLSVAGFNNLFVGINAGASNTTGELNTAFGPGALRFNTDGVENTAIGYTALLHNTGSQNTATGKQALLGNTTGSDNTATGYTALIHNTTGGFNTALGAAAGYQLATGSGNILLGYKAGFNFGSSESNNIDIGSAGVTGDGAAALNNGIIRIGTDITQDSNMLFVWSCRLPGGDVHRGHQGRDNRQQHDVHGACRR